jgi:hypothetical protein
MMDEEANIFEVQYLSGRHGRKQKRAPVFMCFNRKYRLLLIKPASWGLHR